MSVRGVRQERMRKRSTSLPSSPPRVVWLMMAVFPRLRADRLCVPSSSSKQTASLEDKKRQHPGGWVLISRGTADGGEGGVARRNGEDEANTPVRVAASEGRWCCYRCWRGGRGRGRGGRRRRRRRRREPEEHFEEKDCSEQVRRCCTVL